MPSRATPAEGPPSGNKAAAARAHLERALVAQDAEDRGACVVWLSASAQAALDAVAAAAGIDTARSAHRRAAVARQLHDDGLLPDDLLPLLVRLNDERKQVLYEGREPNLRDRSWPDVLAAVSGLVHAAEVAEQQRS